MSIKEAFQTEGFFSYFRAVRKFKAIIRIIRLNERLSRRSGSAKKYETAAFNVLTK